MRPVAVVVSLPVADVQRSLRFYRDGLGLRDPDVDDGMIAFELPNLSLFLIEVSQYIGYLDRAGVESKHVPAAGACVVSCAMGSRQEVDDALARARAAGGSAQPPSDQDGSYTGYLSDPDGHLWELVCNARTESAALG